MSVTYNGKRLSTVKEYLIAIPMIGIALSWAILVGILMLTVVLFPLLLIIGLIVWLV